MGDFIDLYSTLPNVIDVGGIRYYMLPGKPIQDIYKSRDEYLRTFGDDREVERILRQYMGFSLQSKKRLKFDDAGDKQALINILKRRAEQLKASEEFSSSVLKNTIFQRSFLNIQKIIEDLSGAGVSAKSAEAVKSEEDDKCIKAKTAVKEIPEDRLFFILLEIAWYLLHPDKVPKDIQCSWAELIQSLDTLRLRGIVDQIKSTAPSVNGTPINYFTKAGLGEIKKSKATNALEMIDEFVKKMDGDDANKEMKDRLEILLKVLKMKKYIDDASPINAATGKSLTNSLITNPMRGGAVTSRVDRPLGQAMLPFFDYFKVVFDPIYTFLESALLSKVPNTNNSIKSVTIPQLVTLLHICNNIKPVNDVSMPDQLSYGMYRVTNVGGDILGFFKNMLNHTAGYIGGSTLPNPDSVKKFGEQLFKLPKVRLTSLIEGDAVYKDPDTIPYTRFLVLNTNFELKVADGPLKDFFKPEDLYILCTNSKNNDIIDKDIPMNLYTIDFENINVSEAGLSGVVPLDDTAKPAGGAGADSDILDKHINITPNVVYNEAELALSIFILFKQLMPK